MFIHTAFQDDSVYLTWNAESGYTIYRRSFKDQSLVLLYFFEVIFTDLRLTIERNILYELL